MHTPLITGSDCEGAGEMFQVTTLDPKNIPVHEDGRLIIHRISSEKETNLTVSGQLNGELMHRHSATYLHSDQPSALRIPTLPAMRQSSG